MDGEELISTLQACTVVGIVVLWCQDGNMEGIVFLFFFCIGWDCCGLSHVLTCCCDPSRVIVHKTGNYTNVSNKCKNKQVNK